MPGDSSSGDVLSPPKEGKSNMYPELRRQLVRGRAGGGGYNLDAREVM